MKVTVAMISIGNGFAHKLTAANSEPPAKFMPVISSISSQLIPFCPPCTPSISAHGKSPISMGEHSLMPRKNSDCGEFGCVILLRNLNRV